MTASDEPAACIRFAMSGDPEPWARKSCEDFWEWPPADMEEMAESIDDVRGGLRAISTRCEGALAAMGGVVLVGDESAPGLEFRIGSEKLRKEAFDWLAGFPVLPHISGLIEGGKGKMGKPGMTAGSLRARRGVF